MSGRRLEAGDGGDGEASVGFLPRRFGKFSNINDLGLVGSGDIKLEGKYLLDLNIMKYMMILLVLRAVGEGVGQELVRVGGRGLL